MIFFIPYCIGVQSTALRMILTKITSISLTVMSPALHSFGLSLVTGLVVAQDVRVMADSRAIVFMPYCIVVRYEGILHHHNVRCPLTTHRLENCLSASTALLSSLSIMSITFLYSGLFHLMMPSRSNTSGRAFIVC